MFIDVPPLVMNKNSLQAKPKKILVVDDSIITRRMICFALQGLNHELIEAADGVDAVRIVSNQPIDLLVTALSLPNVNGLELSRIVRSTGGLEDIPIIMLIQEHDLGYHDESRLVGISLLITKPFNQSQIYNLIKEVFV